LRYWIDIKGAEALAYLLEFSKHTRVNDTFEEKYH